MSDAEQKILDGSAWDEFCDSLKEAGRIIRSEKAPGDAFNQAEGYRYLTRLLRGGLESYLEFSDPMFPVLRCGAHETIKLGADNPDNRYESAAIRSEFDYRITGKRNTVNYLGISSIINKYGSGGTMEVTGHIDHRELEIADDGSFEIIISRTEKPGNWLPMGEDSNSITVRQTFQDRVNEVAADLKIERIGAEEDRPRPLSPEKVVRGLQGASLWVHGAATMFENWAESFLPTMNDLPPADQDYCQSIGGDPNIFYFHSAWELADDEVMVITAPEIPECQTWNFQLDNWWMESLDYRYHQIHFNKHTAHYEPDGSVRVVIAHRDPGVPNWVETAGHNIGTMCWRWIGAQHHPLLDVKVMKQADLV
ncbi:hypothetical protein A3709_10205 [Halioglobus sp. HI00S01]|uniref:DUF1214 domain-containing protein n=1 Tax=Halioglobus sp. HI00S01 TaxID=1822214 RepID=UPI0007C22D2A|nr:DUF1214 domain-containing protein [Halioglobus sp. HI00S01]KZX53489.1 hypothetical protein A3709_10205 [Halioglobus sp. HI00S01]